MPWIPTDDTCPRCGRHRREKFQTKRGFDKNCRLCKGTDVTPEERRARLAGKEEGRKVEDETKVENGVTKTKIRNACGHDFWYEIKRPGSQDWLRKQVCPSCRRRGATPRPTPQPEPTPTPKEETPTPQPEPTPTPKPKVKVDKAWVDHIMDLLPDGVFHSVLPDIIRLVELGLPVWMQGPMGTTKSTLAEQTARALNLDFYPMRCHELMSESQLFGYVDANGTAHRTPLWDAYENGGLFLVDEGDNGNSNLLAALNGALSNGQCVFGGSFLVKQHPDFRIIATANTAGLGPEHGFLGRNGVDLATRDRFVTVMCPIDENLEEAFAEMYLGTSTEEEVAEVIHANARAALETASTKRETVEASAITNAVRKLRQAVESRFSGLVISPRTTIQVALMVRGGFTMREAFSTKLPGLKPSEVDDLLTLVLR